MSNRMRLRGLGAQVEVRCTGAQAEVLSAAMADAWSRCREGDEAEAGPVATPVEVRLDDKADLAYRLMGATQEITRSLISAQVGNLLMLHAGAVCHPVTGDALVFVAPGGTGKTTLARLLGRRFGYVTDETVGITEAGTILPYPKPLSTRRGADTGLKDELSPDALELVRAPASPRVTRVVLLDRRPKVTSPGAEELGFMDALVALVEQTSSLSALPRPLHRLQALIDASGPVLRLRYRDAADIQGHSASLMGPDGLA
jgi:hypothetical protein